ncbi:D-alanine--D-alanine ligase [soil metagenome]
MHILVLEGGDSSEREVSLRSARSVALALINSGHKVTQYDTADGFDGIKDHISGVDIVFPILHGIGGEDGSVQRVLKNLQIPYLGASADVSRVCFDKLVTKEIVTKQGMKTPSFEVVTSSTFMQSVLLDNPYVLKPIQGGSSIDTFIIRSPQKDTESELAQMRSALGRHTQMLLEELIQGQELTVSILGSQALPVIEIIPPEHEEFNYENKYNGKTQELCPPINISHEIQLRAQTIAFELHNILSVRHFSRVDMIVRDGAIYVLEINTIPGLTDTSLLPKAAQTAGMSMEDLVQKFVDLVAINWRN